MSRHSKYYDGLEQLTKEKGVSTRIANDVLYLRKQPQWTQQLEDEFVQQAKTTGQVPDITEVGKHSR